MLSPSAPVTYSQPNGKRSYQLHADLTANVSIPSIECALNAAEVYERVEFGEK